MQYLPAESAWTVLREGQRRVLSEANTGMAVAIDLGEWIGIYPGRKKRKGNGLALSAMKAAYHEKDIVHSGPLYHPYDVKRDTVYIHFIHTGNGLTTHDGEPLRTFSIAGPDKKYVWANARIEGDSVSV